MKTAAMLLLATSGLGGAAARELNTFFLKGKVDDRSYNALGGKGFVGKADFTKFGGKFGPNGGRGSFEGKFGGKFVPKVVPKVDDNGHGNNNLLPKVDSPKFGGKGDFGGKVVGPKFGGKFGGKGDFGGKVVGPKFGGKFDGKFGGKFGYGNGLLKKKGLGYELPTGHPGSVLGYGRRRKPENKPEEPEKPEDKPEELQKPYYG